MVEVLTEYVVEWNKVIKTEEGGEWETTKSYFPDRKSAEKVFRQQRKACLNGYPIIRLMEGTVEIEYGISHHYGGDVLLEMDALENGKVCIWQP